MYVWMQFITYNYKRSLLTTVENMIKKGPVFDIKKVFYFLEKLDQIILPLYFTIDE